MLAMAYSIYITIKYNGQLPAIAFNSFRTQVPFPPKVANTPGVPFKILAPR
jgi:hypothetical protein